MSAFTGLLTLTEHDVDTDVWSLVTPLVWEIGEIGSGNFVVVPIGFISDGASIPWPVNIVFPRWGRKYRRPAVLHDFLLDIGTRRSTADQIFREAMKACGVPLPVRWTFYYAVGFFSAVQAWRRGLGL